MSNPFIPRYARKIYSRKVRTGKVEQYTNSETGEIIENTFTKRIKFDSEDHIRIFVQTAGIMLSLSPPATKVFMMLIYAYRDKNTDLVSYHHDDSIEYFDNKHKKQEEKISRATYYRGINELIDKSVIARHEDKSYTFYVNTNYFYCGSRYAYLQIYDPKSGQEETKYHIKQNR